MSRFNNMAIVNIAGKRQVRVNVSGKSMFFFDMPVWAKHVAIDCSGSVWAFEFDPKHQKEKQIWDSTLGMMNKVGLVGLINNSKDAYISVSGASKKFDLSIGVITESFAPSQEKDFDECKIEDMPLAARVIAVKVDGGDSGEWVDFYYVSNRMEIHDDSITLLNKQRGFTAEVSFKRGTLVKWEK